MILFIIFMIALSVFVLGGLGLWYYINTRQYTLHITQDKNDPNKIRWPVFLEEQKCKIDESMKNSGYADIHSSVTIITFKKDGGSYDPNGLL